MALNQKFRALFDPITVSHLSENALAGEEPIASELGHLNAGEHDLISAAQVYDGVGADLADCVGRPAVQSDAVAFGKREVRD